MLFLREAGEKRIGSAAVFGEWSDGESGAMTGRHRCATAVFFLFLWFGWMGIDGARGETESVRSVRVHAEADESVSIDRAVVEFVLISEGKTAGEAEQKDEFRVGEVRKRVDAEWGGKGSWRTSEIRLQPVRVEERGKKEAKERIVAYRVTRTEAVELAEFARLGGLLAALFAAGVDELTGVQWVSDRLEPLYRELLGKALGKAKEKAELLAKAAGAQLGPVLKIQEGDEHPHPVARFGLASVASLGGGGSALAPVPISGGEMRIRASVEAVYRLW